MNLQEWQDEAYKLSEEKDLDLSIHIVNRSFVPDYSPSEFIWALEITRKYGDLQTNNYYLKHATICVCYYCCKKYKTSKIKFSGAYTWCPYCDTDSVIPLTLSDEKITLSDDQIQLLHKIMFS